ncbi:VWA domain-containing protein [Thermoleophilia bacterium SCSIO 60948]|nr:VWA domain-containing protein [Thermoleophilia bacterium SCSIO 60948]
MKITPRLNFDLVAVEAEDTVHLMLELDAPVAEADRERPNANLEVVLDRSGSMGGGRLVSALQATHSLLGRLRPTDNFGLVVFDDDVGIPVAAGPVGDAVAQRQVLHQIGTGGTTDLGAGLMRGIQECHRVAADGQATLVLLSDGHANRGVVDHDQLAQFARGAYAHGTSSSTIGIGHGYDEDLLAAIARGGSGNTHFALTGDDAGAALASEVDGLLAQTVQAASLTVKPAGSVDAVRLYNDLPTATIEGGFMAELGNLNSAEQRRIVLEIDVPAMAGLGLATVCELELRWVDVDSMTSKVKKFPIQVNVVPGDEAAARPEDLEVTTELAFQRAQREKREATDKLRRGEHTEAVRDFRASARKLRDIDVAEAPAALREEIAREANVLEDLAAQSDTHDELDRMIAAKQARMDEHMKSRKRGRG